jgi:asparagine synthetase B (glutamine-hydrolysing)
VCGITRIVKFNSLIEDPLKIVDMNNLLRHRGPDDEGYLSHKKVILRNLNLYIPQC